MKKTVIIFCALAIIVGCLLTTMPKAAEPKAIEAEVKPSPPTAPSPICETIAEPEETIPPTPENTLVEPVCAEETEIVAAPEPEPIAIKEVPTPTAPTQSVQQPTEQTEGGIRTIDDQQQLYVPGFGWMDYNGDQSICIVVTSDGDINKMVGSMGDEPADTCPND